MGGTKAGCRGGRLENDAAGVTLAGPHKLGLFLRNNLQDGTVEMMKGDRDARLEASAYPLIVFVHVPKTAGSTVTRTLELCTPRGYRDVQYLVDNRTELLDAAHNSDWVSGHVP